MTHEEKIKHLNKTLRSWRRKKTFLGHEMIVKEESNLYSLKIVYGNYRGEPQLIEYSLGVKR